MQTKLISLYSIPGAILILIIQIYRQKTGRSAIFSNLTFLAIGIAIPSLIFETYKLLSLGWSSYLENWKQYMAALAEMGAGKSLDWTALLERFKILSQIYIAWLTIPLCVTAIIINAKFGNQKSTLSLAAFALLISGATGLLYWLLLSLGWPRYAWIAMGQIFTASAFLLGSVAWRQNWIPVTAMLLLLPFCLLIKPYISERGLHTRDRKPQDSPDQQDLYGYRRAHNQIHIAPIKGITLGNRPISAV